MWLMTGKRQRKYSYGVASNSRFFEDSPREFDGTRRNSDLPLFDLSTIIAATNNFSVFNKLGEGGFGSVYKVVSLKESQNLHNFISCVKASIIPSLMFRDSWCKTLLGEIELAQIIKS